MQYDLEYHKSLDRSHILPNILQGAQTGIFSQFISDIILSLLLYNEQIIIEDIKISQLPSYYAAMASGIIASFLSIYLDPIALIAFTTITYGYVFEISDYIINNNEITLTPAEDVFDIGITILFVVLFDPVARHQYLRFSQKRHLIEPTLERKNRSLGLTIFITVFTSTYGFLKLTSKEKDEKQISS